MNADQAELLRHAVLECLVARHPVALPVAGILRRVRTELDFGLAEADVTASLELLKGLSLAEYEFDALGSSKWWKATSGAVLKTERAA